MKLYFTSDLHGSTKCWRKFLASARFYEADVIIVGGDITGKFLVPILDRNDRFECEYQGSMHRFEGKAALSEFIGLVVDSGSYPMVVTVDELARYRSDPKLVDDAFRSSVLARISEWVELANAKLGGSSVRCFVSAGNDDFWEIDECLNSSTAIVCPDQKIVDIGGNIEMFGLGYANLTPWHCPRDISEAQLANKIDSLVAELRDPAHAIFDIHVPPYGSGLDFAPRLDNELRVVRTASGEVDLIPVGSTAVRDAISNYQPMLGLHGHVHESEGVRQIGKTTVVNPGSEYQAGLLHGALIDIDSRRGTVHAQLVAG